MRAIIISVVVAVAISCGGGTSEPSSLSNGPSSTSVSPTAVSMPDASLLVLTADDLGPTFSSVREDYVGSDYRIQYTNNERTAVTEVGSVRVQVGFFGTPRTPVALLTDPNDTTQKDLVSATFEVLYGFDEVLDVIAVDLGTLGLPYVAYRAEYRAEEFLWTAYIVQINHQRAGATLVITASNEAGLGGTSLAALTNNTRTFAERQAEKLIRLLPSD